MIPNGHFLDFKNKLSNLESRVEQLVSKRKKFEAAKIENEELKREQTILKNQIQNITAKKEMFRCSKNVPIRTSLALKF